MLKLSQFWTQIKLIIKYSWTNDKTFLEILKLIIYYYYFYYYYYDDDDDDDDYLYVPYSRSWELLE